MIPTLLSDSYDECSFHLVARERKTGVSLSLLLRIGEESVLYSLSLEKGKSPIQSLFLFRQRGFFFPKAESTRFKRIINLFS